ncbi:MAG: hypothetical protein AVDCRST_MAG53-2255 [uncultured Solirubrobacteraceae bacterium]|uniref:Uncharacterized protein n=1 Tax=uncultured Solirubrobacteraceae bacterium TaxID=1162706 RepID=A0A6J4SH72_9ACTN|nr:MAG: hypothetical protein AVDCRST_MAG53-2255 [uncultured Solirubrobacteraceae bacterium]
MRGILDFYRRNPVVLVVAVILGLAVSLLAAAGESGSIVTEVLAVGVLGLALGLAIAWNRGRRDQD